MLHPLADSIKERRTHTPPHVGVVCTTLHMGVACNPPLLIVHSQHVDEDSNTCCDQHDV